MGRTGTGGEGSREGGAGLLLTPRWIVGHLLVTALVLLFVGLGAWQLDRLGSRVARNELIEERMESPAAPVTELIETGASNEELAYRSATAAGRYDPAAEVLLRSRSHQREAGWHVLTPLVLDDGRAVLVDRGWVPYAMNTPPVADARPPEGGVEVAGRLRPEQDPPVGFLARFAPRDPAEGRLAASFYVDVDRLAGQMPYDLLPVYLELVEQAPAQAGDLPIPPEAPDLDTGPHLAYALQWFAFALIGVIGYALLLRRTARGG